jgi:hypothetical protein
MLNPSDRIPLLSSLTPPEGYSLDFALGTSFTLDLLSLLTVPMGFAFSDWHGAEGDEKADSIVLLEALRRSAELMAIFCQRGRISVPKNVDLLYGYLENSIYEVAPADQNGVFHPKVWILRFVSKKDEPIRYRMLCSSRNLSPARSWDTLLCLDGSVADRDLGIRANHPMADFVSELPKLTSRTLSPGHKKNIDKVQNELRITKFELPEGFENYQFWPFGIEGYKKWPFDSRVDRLLIMAPFVDDGFLRRFSDVGIDNILISRVETLSALLPDSFLNFRKIYYFNPEAKQEEDTSDRIQDDTDVPLDGLHAKLFILEQGWDAHILTGSANATGAAFGRNVEFLTKLGGKKSQFGIDSLLKSSDKKEIVDFIDLLREFKPESPTLPDAEKRAIEELLDDLRNQVSQAGIRAEVSSTEKENIFGLRLLAGSKRTALKLTPELKIKCWPISFPEIKALTPNFESDIVADFGPSSFERITSFFAFEIAYRKKDRSAAVRFVLNLLLEGAPANRMDRLLYSFLSDRNRFMRFLFFLLTDENPEYHDMAERLSRQGSEKGSSEREPLFSITVFEMFVRALYRDPSKLDRVNRLVLDLKKDEQGRKLLPDEFDTIWEPIWQARQGMKNEE